MESLKEIPYALFNPNRNQVGSGGRVIEVPTPLETGGVASSRASRASHLRSEAYPVQQIEDGWGGGMVYQKDSDSKLFRNRMVAWRVYGNWITLLEESLDTDLEENLLQLHFSEPVVRGSVAIFESTDEEDYICVCAITSSKSLHRICFRKDADPSSKGFHSVFSSSVPKSGEHQYTRHFQARTIPEDVKIICAHWLNPCNAVVGCSDGKVICMNFGQSVAKSSRLKEVAFKDASVVKSLWMGMRNTETMQSIVAIDTISHEGDVFMFTVSADWNLRVWTMSKKCVVSTYDLKTWFPSHSSSENMTMSAKLECLDIDGEDEGFRILLNVSSYNGDVTPKIVLLRGELSEEDDALLEVSREFTIPEEANQCQLVDFCFDTDALWSIWRAGNQKDMIVYHMNPMALTGPRNSCGQVAPSVHDFCHGFLYDDELFCLDDIPDEYSDAVQSIDGFFLGRLFAPSRFTILCIKRALMEMMPDMSQQWRFVVYSEFQKIVLSYVNSKCDSISSALQDRVAVWQHFLSVCLKHFQVENVSLGLFSVGKTFLPGTPVIVRSGGLSISLPCLLVTDPTRNVLSLERDSELVKRSEFREIYEILPAIHQFSHDFIEMESRLCSWHMSHPFSDSLSLNALQRSIFEAVKKKKFSPPSDPSRSSTFKRSHAQDFLVNLLLKTSSFITTRKEDQIFILKRLVQSITPPCGSPEAEVEDDSKETSRRLDYNYDLGVDAMDWCESLFQSTNMRMCFSSLLSSVLMEAFHKCFRVVMYLAILHECAPPFLTSYTLRVLRDSLIPHGINCLRAWGLLRWISLQRVNRMKAMEEEKDASSTLNVATSLSFKPTFMGAASTDALGTKLEKEPFQVILNEPILESFFRFLSSTGWFQQQASIHGQADIQDMLLSHLNSEQGSTTINTKLRFITRLISILVQSIWELNCFSTGSDDHRKMSVRLFSSSKTREVEDVSEILSQSKRGSSPKSLADGAFTSKWICFLRSSGQFSVLEGFVRAFLLDFDHDGRHDAPCFDSMYSSLSPARTSQSLIGFLGLLRDCYLDRFHSLQKMGDKSDAMSSTLVKECSSRETLKKAIECFFECFVIAEEVGLKENNGDDMDEEDIDLEFNLQYLDPNHLSSLCERQLDSLVDFFESLKGMSKGLTSSSSPDSSAASNEGILQVLYFGLAYLKKRDKVLKRKRKAFYVFLYMNIFKYALELHRFHDAYVAVMALPSGSKQENCLTRLITHLCELGRVDLICRFPWVGCDGIVDSILEWRAANSDVVSTTLSPNVHGGGLEAERYPSMYHVLYAYHFSRGNFVKAATAMSALQQRLALESHSDSKESLHRQYDALVSCLNVLKLVGDHDQWIVGKKVVLSSHSSLASSSKKLEIRRSSSLEDAKMKDAAHTKLDVLTLKKIQSDAAALYARIAIQETRHAGDLKNGAHASGSRMWSTVKSVLSKDMDVTDVMSLLVESGLVETATSLAIHSDSDLSSIICSLTRACMKQSHDSLRKNRQNVEDVDSWQLLRCVLEKVDSLKTNFKYHVAAVRTILQTDNRFELPVWLVNSFLGRDASGAIFCRDITTMKTRKDLQEVSFARSGSNPVALIRLYLQYGLLYQACKLVMMLLPHPKTGHVDKKMSQYAHGDRLEWLPYTLIDALFDMCKQRLMRSGTKEDVHQHDLLKDAFTHLQKDLQDYYKFIETADQSRLVGQKSHQFMPIRM